MPAPIITLTTDFGTSDAFVGTMKGVILGIAPDANIVDLTHDIAPQDVQGGAYSLASSVNYFPPGTIHVAVIDPGVGTRRRPIAVDTGSAIYICPDNGLLSYPLEHAGAHVDRADFTMGRVAVPQGWQATHLSTANYWLQPLSSTFHGRDIFAPLAAHLAAGVSLSAMGTRVIDLAAFALPRPRLAGDTAVGQVLHIDRFGNLITNLRTSDLPAGRLEIRIGGVAIAGLSESYQDGTDLLALIGSSGTLEVAFRNGNASRTIGAPVGADVHVIGRA